MTAVKFFTHASLATLIIFLSACGWHLRGNEPLPDNLRILHLQTADPNSELSRSLKRALTTLGTTFKPMAQKPPLSLSISKLSEQRRSVSTGSRGKDAEYALISSISYQVKNSAGKITAGPTTLSVEKVYLFDSNNVLGSYEEERLLRHEMLRELVQQLLRHYRALKTTEATPQS